MKRSRFSYEQIIRILNEHRSGKTTKEIPLYLLVFKSRNQLLKIMPTPSKLLLSIFAFTLSGGLAQADPKPLIEAKTVKDFEEISNTGESLEDKEQALLRVIELLLEEDDFKGAAQKCKLFLDQEEGFPKSDRRGIVSLYLGKSQEELGLKDDAIVSYLKTWAQYMGQISVSAPALEGYMRLVWERNKPAVDDLPSDREQAVEAASKYIELTSRFKDKLTDEELQSWLRVEKLLKLYQGQK